MPEQFLEGTDITSGGGSGFNINTRFMYDLDSGSLYYDHNGLAGGGIEIAKLTGNPDLDNTSLILIS